MTGGVSDQGETPGVQWRGLLRELWLDLLALVWPTMCVGCEAPDRDLCDACLTDLSTQTATVQRREMGVQCAGSTAGTAGTTSTAGTTQQASVIPVFSAGAYGGVMQQMLIALKHRGQVGFARHLGRRLVMALEVVLSECDPHAPVLLVCIPSRAARVRERGYRHVELIVRRALRSLPTPMPTLVRMARLLKPLRGRTGQVGLTASERTKNARRIAVRQRTLSQQLRRMQSLRVSSHEFQKPQPSVRRAPQPPVPQPPVPQVIVVDDIVTSGATMRAACEVLIAAGVRVVAAVSMGLVERVDQVDAEADAEAESLGDGSVGIVGVAEEGESSRKESDFGWQPARRKR